MSTSAPSSPTLNSRALVALSIANTHSQSHPTSRSSAHSMSTPLFESPQRDLGHWQQILRASNQVVLYNPRSHALSIASAATSQPSPVMAWRRKKECPYCKQRLPFEFESYQGENEGDMHSRPEVGGPRDLSDADSDRWERGFSELGSPEGEEGEGEIETLSTDPAYHSRASDYFQLLEIANERSISGAPSPPLVDGLHAAAVDENGSVHNFPTARDQSPNTSAFPAEKMAEGYFKTFFQEEYKLGMGANGSVFLCQHLLDGNPLGHFAVKKIAVGESHSYLLKILREVRLLERLHHPNIITYHHAWLESARFSSFGPAVPTLHVLMQWAEGGSLDDFIDIRLGRKPAHIHMHPLMSTEPQRPAYTPSEEMRTPASGARHLRFAEAVETRAREQDPGPSHAPSGLQDAHSRSARIKAFRAYQRARPEEKERMKREMDDVLGNEGQSKTRTEWTAVHLLSAVEVKSLFRDVVEGLGFLHDKSILHLDLKPGNVLLTWDEGSMIPRAMLSDFGTSRDMINSSRIQRSGNTGTLEYTAPETLPSPDTGLLQQIDSKADMWSLGMILHKLLFFKLPYRYAAEGDANGEPVSQNEEAVKMDRLEKEVLDYPGFKSSTDLAASFATRRLPPAFLVLLENLLHKSTMIRPSCTRVATAIREGKLDPLSESSTAQLPLRARSSSGGNNDGHVQKDRARLLALPSPTEVLGPEENSWRAWLSPSRWKHSICGRGIKGGWRRILWGNPAVVTRVGIDRRLHKPRPRSWRVLSLRVFRSVLLAGKVLTIPRLCSDPTTRAHPAMAALLFGAAVSDTVVDYDPWERGIAISLGLALLHAGAIRFGGANIGAWGWGQRTCVPLLG